MLEIDIIQLSESSFSSPILMVTRNYCSCHMCLDYGNIINVIDELLYEMHGVFFFNKFDFHSIYHQVIIW